MLSRNCANTTPTIGTFNATTMAKTRRKKAVAAQSATPELPTPVLKARKEQLPLQTLLDGYIWVVPKFLTPAECTAWVDFFDASQTTHLQQQGTRYMAARECLRHQFPSPSVAQNLSDRLLATCPQATQVIDGDYQGCNPRIRLYKYTKGMSFGKHIDGSDAVAGMGVTRITALVYLSECQGGATSFESPVGKKPIAFAPRLGSLLLHLHGDDCLEHEGQAVLAGQKYILRTDLVYDK